MASEAMNSGQGENISAFNQQYVWNCNLNNKEKWQVLKMVGLLKI